MASPSSERSALNDEPFVGRADDLRAVADALDKARVVTLLGPPGLGKTTLALRLMSSPDASWDAAFFCDLTEARTPAGVIGAVAEALEIPVTAGANPDDAAGQVGRALASRGRVLVVLDNFEQLVDVATSLVARWSDEAPEARLLVTSRAALGLRAERTFPLAPLTLDAAADLFAQRAGPGFVLDEADRPVLEEICRRLDGLPLAIHLAATRAEVLGPEGLLERLKASAVELKHPHRDADARHQTLASAIAWSWDLLADDERRALGACSVFRGGFDLDAAEAVVGTADALDVLTRLRDRSLLMVRSSRAGRRFHPYESIRVFARDRLEATGERDATLARHAEYFVVLGRTLGARVNGPDAGKVRARLRTERENLLAVFHRFLESDLERAVPALLCLQELCLSEEGWLAGFMDLVDAALDALEGSNADALEAEARTARGKARRLAGLAERAQADLDRAIELGGPAPGDAVTARALRERAHVRLTQGDEPGALEDLERAKAIASARDDDVMLGQVLSDRASWDYENLEGAEAVLEESIKLLHRAGHYGFEAVSLARLAHIAYQRPDLDRAHRYATQARELFENAGALQFRSLAEHVLSSVAFERGDVDEARALLEATLARDGSIGLSWNLCFLLLNLGSIEMCAGNLDRAEELLEHALRRNREVGYPLGETRAHNLLASCAALRGDLAAAKARLARAEASAAAPSAQVAAPLLAMSRGILALARAERAEKAGDDDAARAGFVDADAALTAGSAAEGELLVGEEIGQEQRRLVMALRQRLEARADADAAPSDGSAPGPGDEDDARIAIALDGRAFTVPGADPVDLERHPVLRGLLSALARACHDDPGAPRTRVQLIEETWPGERILPSSAANRLYVAIASLRRRGLRRALLHERDGYLLDPRAVVVLPEAGAGN